MSTPGAIACIGGGGFRTADTSGVQERFLLSLVPESRRREDSEPWRAPPLAGVKRAPAYGVREGGLLVARPGAAPEFVASKPGVTANVRLPGEEAREVPAIDLSSR